MFSGSETVIILAHSDPRKRVHSLEKPPSLADQGCWNPRKAQVCLQGQVAHGQNFSLVGGPQPEALIIGLAKEFVQGFPYTLIEKPERTFGPTQYNTDSRPWPRLDKSASRDGGQISISEISSPSGSDTCQSLWATVEDSIGKSCDLMSPLILMQLGPHSGGSRHWCPNHGDLWPDPWP